MKRLFSGKLKCLILSFYLFTQIPLFAQEPPFLLVGTYTSETGSQGIYVFRFNADSATLSPGGPAEFSADPSYLAVSSNNRFVYAVNELHNGQGSGGSVSAYSFNQASGKLSFINKVPSGGDDPCYIDLHPGGKWAAVANYSSGTLSILPVRADGSLGEPVTHIQHQGQGPNKGRQEKAHIHSTVFSADGKYLYVADLGTDKEYVYRFNDHTGHLEKPAFPDEISVDPGGGPRHFILHPSGKFAYLVEEMGGAVCAYSVENGSLQFIQRMSTLPTDFEGDNTSADIHISSDGNYLYVSNRGESNSIAAFSINDRTGKLSAADYQSTLGQVPRNFTISPDGRYLLVANQKTNDIVIFFRNPGTGQLSDTGQKISVPAPVCLKWIITGKTP